MTWQTELALWLVAPRPHDPPGGATSCYAWLKTNGPAILAAVPEAATLERLMGVIECDRTAVHRRVDAIRSVIGRRRWLAVSRGPYRYDDDHWHKEISWAFEELQKQLDLLIAESNAGSLVDCPETSEGVAKALRESGEPPACFRRVGPATAQQFGAAISQTTEAMRAIGKTTIRLHVDDADEIASYLRRPRPGAVG